MKSNRIMDVHCIYCGKLFLKARYPNKNSRLRNARPSNVSTCCTRCSSNLIYLKAYGRRRS